MSFCRIFAVLLALTILQAITADAIKCYVCTGMGDSCAKDKLEADKAKYLVTCPSGMDRCIRVWAKKDNVTAVVNSCASIAVCDAAKKAFENFTGQWAVSCCETDECNAGSTVLPTHPTLMPSKTPPCPSGNECPPGWESFNSFCYLAMSGNGTLTWHQSQQYCRRHGGDLVKITSARENEFVLALARKKAPSRQQIWIGLMWTANAFYWSDYSVPVYRNWAPNEPNGKAREPCSNMWTGHTSPLPIRASGYWNDRTCQGSPHFPCGFVCKALP
ncbi:hypothetical protein ACROYT_G002799 [Oculina patagonica]